jgi:hypothetical protein
MSVYSLLFLSQCILSKHCPVTALIHTEEKHLQVIYKEFTYICIYTHGTGIWTQGFLLTRRVLYHLSQASRPKDTFFFFFNCFYIYSNVYTLFGSPSPPTPTKDIFLIASYLPWLPYCLFFFLILKSSAVISAIR